MFQAVLSIPICRTRIWAPPTLPGSRRTGAEGEELWSSGTSPSLLMRILSGSQWCDAIFPKKVGHQSTIVKDWMGAKSQNLVLHSQMAGRWCTNMCTNEGTLFYASKQILCVVNKYMHCPWTKCFKNAHCYSYFAINRSQCCSFWSFLPDRWCFDTIHLRDTCAANIIQTSFRTYLKTHLQPGYNIYSARVLKFLSLLTWHL